MPEHNPLVLGKVAASLDYLSNGRFALGIGIGWLEEEFKAIGVPVSRTTQPAEYVEAMRNLWGDERNSSYNRGEFVNFEGARSFPEPVQGRKLPILVGGQTIRRLKRAAEYGDGWCGFNLTPERDRAEVRALARTDESGRSYASEFRNLDVTAGHRQARRSQALS